jgi:hypothetical protein
MYQIIRVEKLGTRGEIGASAEHTFRERKTDNADPTRTHLNRTVGAKSSAEVFAAMDARLAMVRHQKHAVPLIEYLITASPEFFETTSKAQHTAYWGSVAKWLKAKHGAENVICMNLQLDESTPHLVAYVVPIAEKPGGVRKRAVGRGTKKQLIEVMEPPRPQLQAKAFCDGSEKLAAMQTDFHTQVASKFGLQRGVEGSTARHERVKRFYGEIEPKTKLLEAAEARNSSYRAELDQKAAEIEVQRHALQVYSQKILCAFDQAPKALQHEIADAYAALQAVFASPKPPTPSVLPKPRPSVVPDDPSGGLPPPKKRRPGP